MKIIFKIILFVCAMIYLLSKEKFSVADLVVIILLIFFVSLVSWLEDKLKHQDK